MRMRNLNSFLALAFSLGLTTVGCMRESSRIGEGDVATNAFTNQNSENSTPPSQKPAGKIGGEPIDVRQYPFAKKDEFKSAMGDRLQAVDQAIGAMKVSQGSSPQASAKLQALEKQADRLEGQLKTVDSVPAQNWDSFKSKFRDQVVSLETSYNDAVTALR